MALWMEDGSEPKTNEEVADLQAISALKKVAAIELKEKGNEYVKKGKKHYSDAIDCYTRAINQKAESDSDNSILYSNRAHVNLLLGNYRRALQDAEEAMQLCPTNVKAIYRAAKASFSLNLIDEAKSYCEKGIQLCADNVELIKLAEQINVKKLEYERRELEISKAVATAEDVVTAFEDRQIKLGRPMYQELTGVKRPVLDKNNILHWPVLFLYAEIMSGDIIEDFCETDMFSVHLDMISLLKLLLFFEDSPPLPWDTKKAYTRDAVELYYEAGSGVCLSKKEVVSYLLEGTAASHLENYRVRDTDVAAHTSFSSGDGPRWVKVNEKKTLHDILKNQDLIVPGIPVFFVVSRRSSFYEDFRSGKWASPKIA
ncbi:Tetratricopeptide repeat (TPR)-like superfamily protein [Striga hermonthica]|uniref:Tetratricopeptide repeat (TPR)-like superfamily protein n=1 Tax=Striga hermonthica TaxID=68872 RepID=A0A9N7NCZ1_STRHE|nr:Tetratricopeptide repeat (TPR)-like superfamily protein [Striga hermonthica]